MDLAARHADVWETSYQLPADFEVLASRFDAPRDRVARALEIDVFVAGSSEGLAELDGQLRSERGSQRAEQVMSRSIHGLAGDLPAQLAALESAGVDQLLLAFHDPHDISALEIFARAMNVSRMTLKPVPVMTNKKDPDE
jgi:alkanesulfonate monooxygenase SsuD/methylene tetrahydromethanopterin reductase-like flavin-dependent oxidoreductase (luciferase family)